MGRLVQMYGVEANQSTKMVQNARGKADISMQDAEKLIENPSTDAVAPHNRAAFADAVEGTHGDLATFAADVQQLRAKEAQKAPAVQLAKFTR